MDSPNIEDGEHRDALDGLARLNRLSRVSPAIWRGIRQLTGVRRGERLRIVDIGSGGGDVTTRLWEIAHKRGVELQIHGYDVSPTAVSYAQKRVPPGAPIAFHVVDVLHDQWPVRQVDVVVSSLFLHHLSVLDATRLLARMAEIASCGVLVNDLRRSILGYAVAQVACWSVTRSRIVRVDGPRSVRNAFSVSEVRNLADEAGLKPAVVASQWPWRLMLSYRMKHPS